jgi:hypothetical protein
MVNIFYTDEDPKISAQNLDNVRVVKMVTELCAASLTAQGDNVTFVPPYKSTPGQRKHPCCLWAAKSSKNYAWLLRHFVHLEREYQARFPKRKNVHSKPHSHFKVVKEWFLNNKDVFEKRSFTMPAIATNNKLFANYGEKDDAVVKYKIIMLHKWWLKDMRQPTWGRYYPPGWIRDEQLFKDMAAMSIMKDSRRFDTQSKKKRKKDV